MIKNCKHCQNAFDAKSKRFIYCSKECGLKERYNRNRDIKLNNQKKYYLENKDAVLAYQRKYRIEHKKEISDYHKRISIIHKQNKSIEDKHKIRIYKRNYQRKRKKEDINYRLAFNLRARISMAIKNNYKSGSAVDDLGCSIEFLKQHLESKFYQNQKTGEDMTWDNYGKWQIDHIVPLASFVLTNREQFVKACHYTNLQPLWKEDHFNKTSVDIAQIKCNSHVTI